MAALGAEVQRGSLDDLDRLRAGAAAADGVVHLGYHHDFSQMEPAAQLDRQAIEVFGDVLQDTGGPLLVASGVAGMTADGKVTERDTPDPSAHPRIANAKAALDLAERGVRPIVVRFAQTVHGPGDYGFTSVLVDIARDKGVSGYIEDGAGRWPTVHRLDAANLVRRAVDDAPAGSVLHAIAEGLPTRDIAEAIGRGLGLPTASAPAAQAAEHFGWLGQFFAMDSPASSALTRKLLSWQPTHPELIEELDAGYYFQNAPRPVPG